MGDFEGFMTWVDEVTADVDVTRETRSEAWRCNWIACKFNIKIKFLTDEELLLMGEQRK